MFFFLNVLKMFILINLTTRIQCYENALCYLGRLLWYIFDFWLHIKDWRIQKTSLWSRSFFTKLYTSENKKWTTLLTIWFSVTGKTEHGYAVDSPGANSSSPDRPLTDVPRVVKDIFNEYKHLHTVCCQSDNDIWICGYAKILKLYNLQGN